MTSIKGMVSPIAASRGMRSNHQAIPVLQMVGPWVISHAQLDVK